MNKKSIIIIGSILVLVVLGVAAYFAWQNKEKIVEVMPEIIGGGIVPIEQKEERLNAISSKRVKTFWTQRVATSSKVFYVSEDTSIMEIDEKGVETPSVIGLQNAVDIIPARSGNWLAGRISEEGSAAIYDTAKNMRIGDFIGIASIAWGAEEGKIAMLVAGTDAGAIAPQVVVRDVKDGKIAPQAIIKFDLQGFVLQWPQKEAMFLTQKPSADHMSDMWKIDVKTKKLQKFLSGRGLIVQWSSLGDRALKFTTTEGRDHKLAVIDDKGMELTGLRFITMPDKCVIMTPTQMYCAIPRDQAALSHAILPDDYLKRDIYFQDGIYQIDLATGGIRAIFEEEEPKIDATDLTVLDDRILFINRYDKKLYSLNLQ